MATRALIGYLEDGVLTSTYNHYDGYPEHLGKALNNFFASPSLAKDIANYGYISYIDADTGEIEAKNQDTPDKLDLNKMDPNQAIEEVASLIDSYGADYAYFFTPNADKWDYIKNNGIRSMIDSLEGILFGDFDNTYDKEEMDEAYHIGDNKEVVTNEAKVNLLTHIMMSLDALEKSIDPIEKDNFETYKSSVVRGFAGSLSYISDMMKKLEKIELTIHEWNEAMRMPTPHRNKKKYYRKEKHKDAWKSEK